MDAGDVTPKRFAPCQIELEFGDGTYMFRLPLLRLAELEDKCGAGLGAIYKRVLLGDYYIKDCIETIRLGLIGGGVEAVPARRLVDRYAEDMPKKFLWQHALAILTACVAGYEPAVASLKKKEGRRAKTASTSRVPTGTEPS